MKRKKILVVDDSELIHRMYEIVFWSQRPDGALLVHALNGKEALDLLPQHPDVDLILLDINMPIMSGLEFLAEWKKHEVFRSIPVVIVSSEGKQEDTVRALKNGARAYITKPFHPADLHRLIGKVLGPVVTGAEAV